MLIASINKRVEVLGITRADSNSKIQKIFLSHRPIDMNFCLFCLARALSVNITNVNRSYGPFNETHRRQIVSRSKDHCYVLLLPTFANSFSFKISRIAKALKRYLGHHSNRSSDSP